MPRGKESVGWLQSTKARHNGRAGRKGLWFRARPVGPANRARARCSAAAESGNINETLTPAADTPAARTAVPAAWRARHGPRRHPYGQIGPAHVRPPVTYAPLVRRLTPE